MWYKTDREVEILVLVSWFVFVGDGDVNGIRDAEDNGYGEEDKSNDYEGEEDGRRGG